MPHCHSHSKPVNVLTHLDASLIHEVSARTRSDQPHELHTHRRKTYSLHTLAPLGYLQTLSSIRFPMPKGAEHSQRTSGHTKRGPSNRVREPRQPVSPPRSNALHLGTPSM
jgi:hypothetical protein